MVSAWLSMLTPFRGWIPPTRSALQAGWKRMTSWIPGYPWQCADAPDMATAATGWLTEAPWMPRNEVHFIRITACSFLIFWYTFLAATQDWFSCLSYSWCITDWVMIRGWCSVFCCFSCRLIVWWWIRSEGEKVMYNNWHIVHLLFHYIKEIFCEDFRWRATCRINN